MFLSVKYMSILFVDGQLLEANPEDEGESVGLLVQALSEGKQLLQETIERSYAHQHHLNLHAELARPSIAVMLLHRTPSMALRTEADKTGIWRSVFELQAPYRPYWQAAERAGFSAELRNASAGRGISGLFLFVREQQESRALVVVEAPN